jgi:hypothetical protein
MARSLLILCCLLVGLWQSRCTTRSIDIQLPAGGNRPVLLSLMNDSDSVDIFVGRTAPARGQAPGSVYVRDAAVQVLTNGQVVAQKGRYVGGGIYRLKRETALIPGQAYQTRVSAPNWGTLLSLPDTLPVPVSITGFVSTAQSCTLTFTDPPGRNYYAINIELYKGNERVFKVPNLISTFNDDLFNGKTHQIVFSPSNTASRYTQTDEASISTADVAQIRLLSISRRTHQFLTSIDEYELSSGSFDIEPTAPPSGIPGGIGFFGIGSSSVVHTVRFN